MSETRAGVSKGAESMSDQSLESLTRRVEALERAIGLQPAAVPNHEWLSAIGMFSGNEFMKQVDEEGRRIREAERAVAQRDEGE
jgi:hypothetical protein